MLSNKEAVEEWAREKGYVPSPWAIRQAAEMKKNRRLVELWLCILFGGWLGIILFIVGIVVIAAWK